MRSHEKKDGHGRGNWGDTQVKNKSSRRKLPPSLKIKLPALTKIRKFQDELVGETEPLTGDEQPQVENEEPQVPREKTEQVWVMQIRKVPFLNRVKSLL